MNISVLGIDLAKNTFQLQGINTQGKVELKKRWPLWVMPRNLKRADKWPLG